MYYSCASLQILSYKYRDIGLPLLRSAALPCAKCKVAKHFFITTHSPKSAGMTMKPWRVAFRHKDCVRCSKSLLANEPNNYRITIKCVKFSAFAAETLYLTNQLRILYLWYMYISYFEYIVIHVHGYLYFVYIVIYFHSYYTSNTLWCMYISQ